MDDKDKGGAVTGTGTAGSTLGGAVAGAVAGSALGVPVVGTVIGALSGPPLVRQGNGLPGRRRRRQKRRAQPPTSDRKNQKLRRRAHAKLPKKPAAKKAARSSGQKAGAESRTSNEATQDRQEARAKTKQGPVAMAESADGTAGKMASPSPKSDAQMSRLLPAPVREGNPECRRGRNMECATSGARKLLTSRAAPGLRGQFTGAAKEGPTETGLFPAS